MGGRSGTGGEQGATGLLESRRKFLRIRQSARLTGLARRGHWDYQTFKRLPFPRHILQVATTKPLKCRRLRVLRKMTRGPWKRCIMLPSDLYRYYSFRFSDVNINFVLD
jgi:hypothetical protein